MITIARKIKLKIGDIFYNKFGSEMIVKNIKSYSDIDVYFPKYDWIFYKANGSNLKKGNIKCPYERRYCKVGYLGEGDYKLCENYKITDCGERWLSFLKRCYSKSTSHHSYKECEVCEEWLCFQNFAKWYYENYYEVKGEQMHLDKDILVKGNKIYSPKTCIFVPQNINILFTKRQNQRGNCAIGVTKRKDGLKYEMQCRINGKRVHKYFESEEDAFQCYKMMKENEIKRIADNYKSFIPEKLYKAMRSYEIEITD